MKIAVVGSRTFKDIHFMNLLLRYEFRYSYDFISGGATGADSLSELVIDDMNEERKAKKIPLIQKHIFLPDWNKYGKRAGFLRNEQIVDKADKLIAFWDGESKGTKHSIDLAVKKGIPVDIYIRQ